LMVTRYSPARHSLRRRSTSRALSRSARPRARKAAPTLLPPIRDSNSNLECAILAEISGVIAQNAGAPPAKIVYTCRCEAE
jgi:hypothetical protein